MCTVCFHRLACSEDVQFFQFDSSGNMYVFPLGSGCTGIPRLVLPGDDLNFVPERADFTGNVTDAIVSKGILHEVSSTDSGTSDVREFKAPLKEEDLDELSHKNFSPDTMKKVKWVTKMYREWRNYRNSQPHLDKISCDLDHQEMISKDSLMFALSRFLTEVKKVDGSKFPSRTLYDILICVQFHLETLGFAWKLLVDVSFTEVKYTLDNLMKMRTAAGIGKSVKKAQILTSFHEDILWSQGLLGINDLETLLNTVVFIIGKGFSLRAGKEHYSLRRPHFDSQFKFLHDDEGQVFLRYIEDFGLKTNKGGIKHRKVESKEVDLYPIMNVERCPLRIIMWYLSLISKDTTCPSFYLQPRKKFTPGNWFLNRPAGANKLRDVIKDMTKKEGFPGFFTNHSLRSTAATKMYRCNIDEQLIMEITGHRSLAVRSYKRTCDQQRKVASNVLFSQ